jgi:predicted 3-demethylubiquinone-9 3-methyltransferase (glyoxalase superfamily)
MRFRYFAARWAGVHLICVLIARWGLSWQITPRALTEALADGGGEAKRAFQSMMTMNKIDIATIEAARRG